MTRVLTTITAVALDAADEQLLLTGPVPVPLAGWSLVLTAASLALAARCFLQRQATTASLLGIGSVALAAVGRRRGP